MWRRRDGRRLVRGSLGLWKSRLKPAYQAAAGWSRRTRGRPA